MTRILIIDDEAQVLACLRRLFRRAGYEVETAPDGPAGLEKLSAFGPDVVLSDFRMRGMTGAQVLAKVRETRPESLGILLSGYANVSEDVPSEGPDVSSMHFITKPWDDDDLPNVVQSLLGDHRKAAGSPS